MQLNKALEQISEIHAQVLKAEVFRGYRAATMSITAGVALGAAALQAGGFHASTAEDFVVFWVGVALLCAAICGVDIFRGTLQQVHRGQRWRTVLVVAQSVPALLVGAVVTAILLQRAGSAAMLPGLWSMLFALGIWSSRPYLPKAIGLVALFYVLAGTWLLAGARGTHVPSPWEMGLTFGVGQSALALVLYLNIERRLQVPGLDRGVDHG
jgi:hypothetical protein